MNNKIKSLTVSEIQQKISALVAKTIENVANGNIDSKYTTPKELYDAYLNYKDGDVEHILPVRIESCAFDDRRNTGTQGDITMRLWATVGGVEMKEPLFSLQQLANNAGLMETADSGKRLQDFIHGQIGVKKGYYYLEAGKTGIMTSNGSGERQDQSLVIHPDDLSLLKEKVLLPATSASLRMRQLPENKNRGIL